MSRGDNKVLTMTVITFEIIVAKLAKLIDDSPMMFKPKFSRIRRNK